MSHVRFDPMGQGAITGPAPRRLLWATVALFTLPALCPYHDLPLTDFYTQWLALAAAVVLGGIGPRAANASLAALDLSSPGLVLLAMVGVLLLQQFAGDFAYLQDFLVPVVVLLVAQGVALAGARCARAAQLPEVATWVAGATLLAALLQCAWVCLQFQGLHLIGPYWVRTDGAGSLRATGPIAQSNALAGLLAWAMVSLFHLQATRRLSILVTAVVAIVLVVFSTATGSRSAWMYAFVLGPLLAVLRHRMGTPRAWLPLAWPVVLVVADPLVRSGILEPLAEATGQVPRELELRSLEVRWALLRDAWAIFLQDPLIGTGWGGFLPARLALPDSRLLEPYGEHAHNLILDLAAQTGVLGLLVVTGGVWIWLRRALRPALDPARAYLWALLAIVALYSLVEFPLFTAYFLLPTAWMMAALEPSLLSFRLSRPAATTLKGAAVVLGLVVLLAPLDYLRVERAYRRFFVAAEGPAIAPQDLLVLGSTTLFRHEVDRLYLRSAPVDPLLAPIELAIAADVMRSLPTADMAVQYGYRLVAAGRIDEGVAVLAGTCRRMPTICPAVREDLRAFAGAVSPSFAEADRELAVLVPEGAGRVRDR